MKKITLSEDKKMIDISVWVMMYSIASAPRVS